VAGADPMLFASGTRMTGFRSLTQAASKMLTSMKKANIFIMGTI
jgi:hypothetical protein